MVLKTRIKRSELIFNIIIIALFAVTAATQLLSAYGAVCVTYNLPTGMPSPPFPADHSWWDMMAHAEAFAFVYIPMNVITWIMAFAWGFLIYAYITKWPWFRFFIVGIVVSALGFISGVLPAIISDTSGFTELFEFGSPHWGRTMANALMFVILILMQVIPPFRRATKKFVEASDVAGRYVKQLIYMSLFFFWLGAVSFLGSTFMADAHMVGGVNVWQTVWFQYVGGVVASIVGATMLSTALIYNQIKPSSALLRAK